MKKAREVVLIRPGAVKYVDLCVHPDQSRSEFFSNCDLKTLTHYGLVMESDDLVKVWFCDDETDDSEGQGIVIPKSCVLDIVYYKEEPIDIGTKFDGMVSDN